MPLLRVGLWGIKSAEREAEPKGRRERERRREGKGEGGEEEREDEEDQIGRHHWRPWIQPCLKQYSSCPLQFHKPKIYRFCFGFL